MPTRLVYVRHGETLGNRAGKFYGHAETPLTDLGIAQARALGRRVAGEHFDAVYASDLSRAADTAAHALAGRDLAVNADARLREMHYGEWEEMDGRDIRGRFPDAWAAFVRGTAPAPGGEDVTALRWRMAAVAREYAARHRDRSVLVVSHGSAIAAMLAELLGTPLAATWSFVVHNTGVTRLQVGADGRFVLVAFNDLAHLEDLEEERSAPRRSWWKW